MIPDLAGAPLRVAIISRSVRQRDCLGEILRHNGLQVVADELIRARLPGRLDREIADVLLVDLDDGAHLGEEVLNVLMDQTGLPILFNDGAAIRAQPTAGDRAWGKRLAGKLIELAQEAGVEEQVPAGDGGPERAGAEEAVPRAPGGLHLVEAARRTDAGARPSEAEAEEIRTDHGSAASAAVPESPPGVDDDGELADAEVARRVWVLGASIGGPQSVKEFLAALPAGLPVAFVLAQHIGTSFVDLLAQQLSRVSCLKVSPARAGVTLRCGQLVVAPVEQCLDFDEQGRVELRPMVQRSVYSPSIDAVMAAVAGHYGADSGAIVFSGMGSDGLKGCAAITARGGTVWIQSGETCVISSMADAVRDAGLAERSGAPVELAEELVRHLSGDTT